MFEYADNTMPEHKETLEMYSVNDLNEITDYFLGPDETINECLSKNVLTVAEV